MALGHHFFHLQEQCMNRSIRGLS